MFTIASGTYNMGERLSNEINSVWTCFYRRYFLQRCRKKACAADGELHFLHSFRCHLV